MSDNLDYTVRLKADGSGFVGTMKLSADEIKKLNDDLNSATGKLKKTETGFDRLRGSAKRLTGQLFSLKGVFATLLSAGTAREIAQTGIAMEGMNSALTAALGSAELAAQEIAYLRAESERLGLQFDALGSSYIKLSAASKGTTLAGQKTRDIFSSVSEAAAVMRLSVEQTDGALLAISQIMSKGTVSAEELRGQLGERLPGAFQIAARSIGVTTEQLGKMLQQGEVMADEFLPKFAAELKKAVAGGLPASVDSTAAAFNRFHNALFELKEAAVKAGFLDLLKDGAISLTETIRELPVYMAKTSAAIQSSWLKISYIVDTVALAISIAWEATTNSIKKSWVSLLNNMASGMNEFPSLFGADQVLSMQLSAAAIEASISPTRNLTAERVKLNKALQLSLDLVEREKKESIDNATRKPLMIGISGSVSSIKKLTKETQDNIGKLSKGIQQSFADTFEEVFHNGVDGFASFFDNLKSMFAKLLADMAAMALARKLLIPIGTAVSAGAGEAVAGGLGTTAAQAGGGINPAIGLGLLAGGALLSNYLSNKRKEEEEQRRLAETMERLRGLTRDLESEMRLLSGASSQAAEDFRQASDEVSTAIKSLGTANDIHQRVAAEESLFNKIRARYDLESSFLDSLGAKIATLTSSLNSERDSLVAAFYQVTGLSDNRSPSQIVGGISLPDSTGSTAGLSQLVNAINSRGGIESTLGGLNVLLSDLSEFYSKWNGNTSGTLNAIGRNPDLKSKSNAFNAQFGDEFGRISFNQPIRGLPAVRAAISDYEEREISNKTDISDALKNLIGDDGLSGELGLFIGNVDESIISLRTAREEVVKYYEAQQRLAETLTASSNTIESVLTRLRRSALNPVARTDDLLSEFRSTASSALGASGYDLAGLGNQLSGLVDPLLAEARNTYASGGSYQTIYNEVIGSLKEVQNRIDSEVPTDYQEASFKALETIDQNIVNLNTTMVAIKTALEAADDSLAKESLAALGEILTQLGGGKDKDIISALDEVRENSKPPDVNVEVTVESNPNVEINMDSQPITDSVLQQLVTLNENGEYIWKGNFGDADAFGVSVPKPTVSAF